MSTSRIVNQNQAPISGDLGTPTGTEPITATGIVNSTVGVAAEKVVSKSTNPAGRARRLKIYNPTAGVSLGYTTTRGAAPTLTSTVAGGGAADGSCIPAQSTEWVTIPDDCDLYMAASAALSPYQITLVEV